MDIVYIERDGEGQVKGVYRQRQDGYAEEAAHEDDAEVQEFLSRF